MLRWMAPFMSFTAEEAWPIFAPGQSGSIFTQTYSDVSAWTDDALLAKWLTLRNIRDSVNLKIEEHRSRGELGSSLQAEVELSATPECKKWLEAFEPDLKFVFIASAVTLADAHEFDFDKEFDFDVRVTPSANTKCDRCWHYRADVGHDPAHPTICGRCTRNLFGAGEHRTVA